MPVAKSIGDVLLTEGVAEQWQQKNMPCTIDNLPCYYGHFLIKSRFVNEMLFINKSWICPLSQGYSSNGSVRPCIVHRTNNTLLTSPLWICRYWKYFWFNKKYSTTLAIDLELHGTCSWQKIFFATFRLYSDNLLQATQQHYMIVSVPRFRALSV